MFEAERKVGKRAVRRARGALVRVASLALVFLIWGCGAGEDAGEQPAGDSTGAVDTAATAAPDRPARLARTAARPRELRIPHAPHRGLACVSCHQTIPGHAAHAQISCNQCHPAPARYASTPVPSSTDCMECHHGGALATRCTNCHATSSLPGPVTVSALMQVANWPQPRRRDLPFDHARHASLVCTECHSESVTRAPNVECRTCHEKHHRLSADCRQCHSAISQSVHTEAAHRGCGGSGCHADAVVASFPPIRSVCLVCHRNMAEHNAPQECAVCHAIPDTWRGTAPSPGRRP